jgi:hypothetical protein
MSTYLPFFFLCCKKDMSNNSRLPLAFFPAEEESLPNVEPTTRQNRPFIWNETQRLKTSEFRLHRGKILVLLLKFWWQEEFMENREK